MAFLVKRGNVYHLSHCANGKRERFSTGLRTDIGQDVRKAKELCAEYGLKEAKSGGTVGQRFRAEEQWENWVHGFVAIRYRNKPGTLRRWQSMWRNLRAYLEEKQIHTPRHLIRQHCFDYLAWRVKTPEEITALRRKGEAVGRYAATHNTAHLELANLRKLMKEAVHRGFAPANPCAELGIGLDEKKKPCDFTDEMLARLEAYIQEQTEPDRTVLWRSYLMARYHGVRLNETNVNPMADVILKPEGKETICFFQKGGRKRVKPLHPKLIPLFTELQAQGAKVLFQKPPSFAAFWWRHMDASGLKENNVKACFHSLRVTVQNRIRRAGVHDEIRRAYLSHEKQGDVHEGYSRIGIDELRVCHAAL